MVYHFALATVQIAALDLETDSLDIIDPIQLLLLMIDTDRHGIVQIIIDNDGSIAAIVIATFDSGSVKVAVRPVYTARNYFRYVTFVLYMYIDIKRA